MKLSILAATFLATLAFGSNSLAAIDAKELTQAVSYNIPSNANVRSYISGDGVVTISGYVSDYYDLNRIEQSVRAVEGVEKLHVLVVVNSK